MLCPLTKGVKAPTYIHMTQGNTLPNGSGPVQSIFRAIFMIAATIGGFFIFMASAAFALFVALGLLILGLAAFTFFWLRAKITGKPLMPRAKMWTAGPQDFNPKDFMGGGAARRAPNDNAPRGKHDGPTIDAHETAHGWSVDED